MGRDQIKVKAWNPAADWAISRTQCVPAKLGQDIKGCRSLLLRGWKVKGWKVKALVAKLRGEEFKRTPPGLEKSESNEA